MKNNTQKIATFFIFIPFIVEIIFVIFISIAGSEIDKLGLGFAHYFFILPILAVMLFTGLVIKGIGYLRKTVPIHYPYLLLFALYSLLLLSQSGFNVLSFDFSFGSELVRKSIFILPIVLHGMISFPPTFFNRKNQIWVLALLIVVLIIASHFTSIKKSDDFIQRVTGGTDYILCTQRQSPQIDGYCSADGLFFNLKSVTDSGYQYELVDIKDVVNQYGVSSHVYRIRVTR